MRFAGDTPATLKVVLLVTLLIKLALAYWLPLSGDEAYFVVWGKHPDLGFYDHPPAVGWMLQLLLYLGQSEAWLRLPAIALSALIGWVMYNLLKPYDEQKAVLVSLLFLLTPLNVLNVLITNDTMLVLFAFLSGVALYKGLQQDHMGWYALSGAMLGMAFLSKYFAALLVVAYLAYFIFSARGRRRILGALLLFASSLPFVFINLYWNYTHCWDNILFNIYNRNPNEHFSFDKIAIFLVMQIYLASPPILYYLFRRRAQFWQSLSGVNLRLFAFLFLLPIALLGLMSLKREIGLHWMLAFYPFLYFVVARCLSREELVSSLKFTVGFTAFHLVALLVVLAIPMESWKKSNYYDGIVYMLKINEVAEQIRPYEQQDFILASDGYTPAAILSYQMNMDVAVFGYGSVYARQDDINTDYRKLGGRNFVVVLKSPPYMGFFEPYFQRVETKEFELYGQPFYLVLGYGFDYDKYRDNVLRLVKEQYYKIPSYLPHDPCYICVKYFPEELR